MTPEPLIPRGRAAWAAYAVLAAILALSSAAPFIQLGAGPPSLGVDDAGATLIYLLTWAPFLVGAAWLMGRGRGAGGWIAQLTLLFTLPAAHAFVFLAARAAIGDERVRLAAIAAAPQLQVFTLLGTLQYLVFLAVLIAVAAGRDAVRARQQASELEASRAQLEVLVARARMDALAAQLRPHFLFNTLNAIGVLAVSDPVAAQTMIRQLSTLLRSVLAMGQRDTVSLDAELQLLDAYLGIQQSRFGEHLHVEISVAADARSLAVPALILQPLVENAIEHAIGASPAGGRIAISASRERTRLVIQVVDSGSDGSNRERTGLGIGHSNTRERLTHMYGGDFRFEMESSPSGSRVLIDLPARAAEVAGS